jgi:hypothetical protein
MVGPLGLQKDEATRAIGSPKVRWADAKVQFQRRVYGRVVRICLVKHCKTMTARFRLFVVIAVLPEPADTQHIIDSFHQNRPKKHHT